MNLLIGTRLTSRIAPDTHPPAAAIALAASAGGVQALVAVTSRLPADLDAAVFAVLHIAPVGPSVLPSILSRHGALAATHPADGETIRAGHIYVAPPDRHLTVAGGTVRVLAGPRENGNRPAADPLLRSVAATFGPRGAGVVLSGTLDDGTLGLAALKRAGGLTIVQDPQEAEFPGMPLSAIRHVGPERVARLDEIAAILVDFVGSVRASMRDRIASVQVQDEDAMEPPSGLTCPDCGGALWVRDDPPLRFRCRVGHAFSPESLLVGKREALEAALWAAIVALEERAELSRRLARRMRDAQPHQRARYLRDAERSLETASVLSELAAEMMGTTPADPLVAPGEDAAGAADALAAGPGAVAAGGTGDER